MTTVQTHSGILFNVFKPVPELVSMRDIATSLARICRFNGHSSRFYSVAEHSLYVSMLAGSIQSTVQFAALLHNAHEAYTGDIVTPLKTETDVRTQDRIQKVIHERFAISVGPGTDRLIKKCDHYMLMLEATHLMHAYGMHWEGVFNAPTEGIEHNASDRTQSALRQIVKCLKQEKAPSEKELITAFLAGGF